MHENNNTLSVTYLYSLSFASMVGSGDHLPTMQAFANKVENAFNSFSLGERSASFKGPMIPIFFSLVNGTLYPTFRPTPVWHEFKPFMSWMPFRFKSLWITATASYRNSAEITISVRYIFYGFYFIQCIFKNEINTLNQLLLV